MSTQSQTDEWLAYLDAYKVHLDAVEDSLNHGRVTTDSFSATPPKSKLPLSLRSEAETLQERGSKLTQELQSRMDTITTILRYSRMKDPDRVILIDVLA
jgi:hypothetical protein